MGWVDLARSSTLWPVVALSPCTMLGAHGADLTVEIVRGELVIRYYTLLRVGFQFEKIDLRIYNMERLTEKNNTHI